MSQSEYDIERGVYQTPSNDDDLYDEYDDEDGFGRGPVFAIFAVIILAAFVGIVWLAYQQGVRHGQMSAPPVIQASNEPFRVAPEDPEGMAEPQETLTDEVFAGESLDDQAAAVVPSAEEPIVTARNEPAVQDATTSASTALSVPPPSSRVRDASASEDLREATSEPSTSPVEEAATHEVEMAAAAPAEVTPSGPEPVVAQPAPELRTQSVASNPEMQGPLAPGEESLFRAGGNYVVQIASVPEQSDADAVWNRLQSRYASIVGSYAQDVQSVDLGERGTWYRLRIGYFGSSADAGTVCDELKAAGQDCLVASR